MSFLKSLLLGTLALLASGAWTETAAQALFPEPGCGFGKLYDSVACRDVEEVLSQTGTLYWVDGEAGSDTNPGTKSKPWKSISRSTRQGVLRPGDAVLIRKGTYREEVRPTTGGSRSGGVTRYVTFAAYPGETVTVSGADVVNRPSQSYNGWKRQSDGSWRHDWVWPSLPSSDDFPYFQLERRELFVDNGQVLFQLGEPSRPTLQRGEFWVEGPGTDPRAVFLKTFDGNDPNDHLMEVGIRKQLFYSDREGDFECGRVDRGYYRLIGLRFTHATTKRQRMAVCSGRRGSLFQNLEVVWNNAGGIILSGSDHVVRNSVISHNGIEGIGGTGVTESIVEYSDISHNHWKWPETYKTTHGGGGKWTRSSNLVIRHNKYVDNRGSGIWFDNNSDNNEVYGNYIEGSIKQGIQVEHGSDANRIYNNVVTRTRYYTPIWSGIGISVSVSDDNFVAYNTLMLNDGSGLRVAGDNRGQAVRAVVYNNLYVDNLQAVRDGGDRLREIQVIGNGPSEGLTPLERVQSHRVDGNAYWYRPPSQASASYSTFMLTPTGDGNLYSNELGEWQDASGGYDLNGLVANLSRETVVDPSDPHAGWVVPANSQYNGQAVALPSGIEPVTTDFYGSLRPVVGGTVGAYQFGGNSRPSPPAPIGVGSVGSLTVNQEDAAEWHRVSFERTFADPVVIMGPLVFRGPGPDRRPGPERDGDWVRVQA